MSALSNFLRQQLRSRGWDQKDLAAESGLRKSTISRLINDRVEEPELPTLLRLAQTLGVSLGDLMELAGYPVRMPTSQEGQQDRLVALGNALPWLVPVIEEIAALPPGELESVLAYLETLRRRRQTE